MKDLAGFTFGDVMFENIFFCLAYSFDQTEMMTHMVVSVCLVIRSRNVSTERAVLYFFDKTLNNSYLIVEESYSPCEIARPH